MLIHASGGLISSAVCYSVLSPVIELMRLSPVAGYRLVTISHCNERCHSGQFLSKSPSAYQVLP